MATTTTVIRTDDLDGSTDNVRNVRISVDGRHFEIDLSEEHIDELHEALKRFTAAGRGLSATQASTGPRRSSTPTNSHPDPKAVRAWATQNGIEVPARGRFPKTVLEAFREAHASNA